MQSNEKKKPEELLSASFDGEFTGVFHVSDERRAELDNEWSIVRSEIRSWPVKSVDLVEAVRAEVSRTPRPLPASQDQHWSGRNAWLAVVTASATIIVLMALPLLRNRGADIGELPAPPVGVGNDLDPANYDIVVVNMAENADIEDTVREMLGAAEDRGAEITSLHSEIDEGAQYSAGFLLTAGSESQVILNSLSSDQETLEWNPVDIDGRTNEEIKALFLALMKVPTKSDKVFGAMYVVDETNLSISMEELRDDTIESTLSVALAAADEPASDSVKTRTGLKASSILKPGETPVAAPLIVIFRKRVSIPTTESDQGNLTHTLNLEPAV